MIELFNSENYKTEYSSWVKFYPKFNQSFYLEKAGYFDERPQLHTSITQLIALIFIISFSFYSLWVLLLTPLILFGWGQLYINLPIKTGIQDSDSAAWGFNYHGNMIWIYIGGGGNFQGGKRWKTITMPWSLEWYRTSLLLKDDSWEHEFRGDQKNFYESKWKDKRYQIRAEYNDQLNNQVVGSTIHITEREWRRKGLMFTKLFNKVKRTIDVEYDSEVGKGKGSWKGGTLGQSFELLDGQSVSDILKKNRFNSVELNRDEMISKILSS